MTSLTPEQHRMLGNIPESGRGTLEAILRLKNENLPRLRICERLCITPGRYNGLVFRGNNPRSHGGRKVAMSDRKRPPKPDLTPVATIPEWLSPQADALLLLDMNRGCVYRRIAERFEVTEGTVWTRRAKLLGISKKYAPKPPKPPPIPYSAGGRGATAFSGRDLGLTAHLPAPIDRHGLCAWPLTCEATAEGRYCTEHTALLRQPSPISAWERAR